MKSILITVLLLIGALPATGAQPEEPTGQAKDPLATKVEIAQAKADIREGLKLCEEYKKSGGKGPAPKPVITINGKPRPLSCEVLKVTLADLSETPDGNQCDREYKSFKEALKEKDGKCAPLGQCVSSEFTSCLEFLEGEGVAEFDDLSDSREQDGIVSKCPYFAKEDQKTLETEETRREDKVVDLEKKLKDLVDRMKKDQEETEKQKADIQQDITKLDGDAHTKLDELQTKLSDLRGVAISQISKASAQIDALKYSMEQKKITELSKATTDYGASLTAIQTQCYKIGLDAAAGEGKKLRSGVAQNYNLGVARTGIVEHLRGIANQAYRDCQSRRMMKGTSDIAYRAYTDKTKMLDSQLRSTQQQINSLNQQMSDIQKQLSPSMQAITQQSYSESMSLVNQSQVKAKQLDQMLAASQQNQAKMQQEMMSIQMQQWNEEKNLRALRSNLESTKKAARPGLPTVEQFTEARSAFDTFKSAKISASNACCPEGTATNGQQEVCLTTTERSAWDVPAVGATSEH